MSSKLRWSAILIGLAAGVLLFPQILRPYTLSGRSMENTLLIGDYVLVELMSGMTPSRGDVVQLRAPIAPNRLLFKRVVAIGGDRLRLCDKTPVVNGSPVYEPYAVHNAESIDVFRDNFPSEPNQRLPREGWEERIKQNTVNGELVVPPGKFFVLGDNRDNSLDGRYWGFLESKDFVGKPLMIYFSKDAESHIRWSRLLLTLQSPAANHAKRDHLQ